MITVVNSRQVCRGVSSVEFDNNALGAADSIALANDGRTHSVRVVLG